ncbi:hypothetical protein [Nostoc sp.]|uniref:hypothetical protein n=1 Tax=Nostoc sp. TaxID=1180 RepID=UPI002FF7EB41
MPLVLLLLAYALLGWYLAANHIIWLVEAFVAAMSIGIITTIYLLITTVGAYICTPLLIYL